jgi:HD-like signal output (HDOD) protein
MSPLFKKKSAGPVTSLGEVLEAAETPTFPQLTLKILDKLRDVEVDFTEIAESLQWDAPLVAKILRTVNSAAYGTATPIVDVRHAVSFLGRAQLEQLVIALAVKVSLPLHAAPGFVPKRFWQVASFRAALSRTLADKLHPAKQAESFTAGLLQDMAVPLLAHAHSDAYGDVLQEWHASPNRSLESIEQGVFGWNHAEIGGALGREWALPDILIESIVDHHRDDQKDDQVLPAVRLVSLLRETAADAGIEAMIETARMEYGISPDWTQEALEACAKQSMELAREMA